MRALITRQKLALVAAGAVSAALLAACGADPLTTTNTTAAPSTSAEVGPKPTYQAGAVLVSDGTTTVRIGDQKVNFPTTVTDAAFSPDGSRIAFVDANGNIATAHPDGTGLIVLTKKQPGVTRSSPTWLQHRIVYTHRKDGVSTLFEVGSNGGNSFNYEGYEADTQFWFGEGPEAGNAAPSASKVEGPGMELAFQHTGAGGAPEVWVVDRNQRSPWSVKIADGAAAELSADGSRVAFVAANGQVSVVEAKEGAKPVQISFGVDTPSHLAWSADGRRVAFQTKTGVQSVKSTPDSSTANPTTDHASSTGVPSFAPPVTDRFARLTEADPVQAAIAASRMRFATMDRYSPSESSPGAYTATITAAKGAGLSGGAIAALTTVGYGGPVLFTTGSGLDKRVKAELQRLFGEISPDFAPEITIMGGPADVPAQVESDLKAMGFHVRRIPAADLAMIGLPDKAADVGLFFVVDSEDRAGLTAAATLGTGFPVLISDNGVLSTRSKALLNTVTGAATIVPLDTAGEQAVGATWSGKPGSLKVDPAIATNAARLRALGAYSRGLLVVDRSVPADVLLATSISRWSGYAVVAVDGGAPLDPALVSWLDASSGMLDTLIVVDSTNKVSNDTIESVMRAVSGPLGFGQVKPTEIKAGA